ncbi:MAG TPA: metalloregulator ArsR/SmtB family transcription factor [Streptosporangiaceae bacterium]|nr:metalloregulator ArsR/SmtB family transcription factor [Streptosporangiaceae bacterium]
MHLLPADRADCRVIDEDRVCQAIAALGAPETVRSQADLFAVLADPTRLTLLTCISAAGPISVSDLAAATGLHDTTVSQALRHLRAAQVVTPQRDGRIIRYQLTDRRVGELLARRPAPAVPAPAVPAPAVPAPAVPAPAVPAPAVPAPAPVGR